ncbi:MAG: hypothetical protein ACOCQ4_00785 [bacterium]
MKTKRRLFLFPILLMATFVFLTTGCSDDDENNGTPYSEEDIIGEWIGDPNSSGDIEVLNFNDDGSSWFGFFLEENNEISWETKEDTWELDDDVVVTEDESGFVLEYEVEMEDTVMTLVEKDEGTVFARLDESIGDDDGDDDGDDEGDEYTMETMSGTFENVAERIKVELSDDGSAILTKVEGDMAGQDGEVDDGATWEIKEYEAPSGVTSEDEPLSIVIEHSNSEFDDNPYVLIIESVDELKDHWQITLSRVDDDGGDDDGGDDDGGDDDDGEDDFSLYEISYFDQIEYKGEDENFSGVTYKEWLVTSSAHPNLSMTIQVSSANSDGTTISNATYDFGSSSDLSSGGAVGYMYDVEETDGWSTETLNAGSMKIENSDSEGCTITLTDAHNSNVEEYYFNGTAEVTF